jgi:Flp pilus assembly secretin CpaC
MGRTAFALTARAAVMTATIIAAAAPALAASRLSVGLNQSVRVPLGGYASSVVVANPSIADVTMVDAHSAVIVGKANGSAEVMVLDSGGKTLLDSIVTVSPSGDRPGLQEGEVTIFLGSTPHEYICSPRCAGDTVKATNTSSPPT